MPTAVAAEVHPFVRAEGAAAWICTCGRSRNSSTHKGQAAPRPRSEATPKVKAGTVAAGTVEPGTQVVTTDQVGTDFGLPLVEPTRRRGGFVRTVRSHLKENGGIVVRFTDGSKTRPLNGHTAFVLADAPETEAAG